MVIFWWDSVSQSTDASLLGVVVLSWIDVLFFSRGKSDKAMLGYSVLLDYVSVRSIVGDMEVSS